MGKQATLSDRQNPGRLKTIQLTIAQIKEINKHLPEVYQIFPKYGRPKAELDYDRLEKLAGLQLTDEELASCLEGVCLFP